MVVFAIFGNENQVDGLVPVKLESWKGFLKLNFFDFEKVAVFKSQVCTDAGKPIHHFLHDMGMFSHIFIITVADRCRNHATPLTSFSQRPCWYQEESRRKKSGVIFDFSSAPKPVLSGNRLCAAPRYKRVRSGLHRRASHRPLAPSPFFAHHRHSLNPQPSTLPSAINPEG